MKTDKQKFVLSHLKAGRSITVKECYFLYHTFDLRRIISRLKQEGHDIEGKFETSPDGSETYKRYHLNQPIRSVTF